MESHLSAGRHGPSATLEAELVFLHVQGREEVEVLDPQKAMEDAGGVLGLTRARTWTRLFSLASMVMFGHLPGNCSELDPEWELGKLTPAYGWQIPHSHSTVNIYLYPAALDNCFPGRPWHRVNVERVCMEVCWTTPVVW